MQEKLIKSEQSSNLSMKDTRIIRELNKDSRQSFSSIGKKVGLPKNVVNYRIKRLVDKGIITLFCMTINRSKLGYMYCRLFLKFHHFSKEIENQVTTYLKTLKAIHWVASLEGSYDMCIIFLAKSLKQVEDIYNPITYTFDKHLLDKEFSIATELYYLPYNYLCDIKDNDITIIKPTEDIIKLDKKDLELMSLIKENSRMPMLDIMMKMEMSQQSIRARVNSLKKRGIITGFNIRIDHTKFGLHHFHTFLNLTSMNKQKETHLINFIASKKSTTHIIKGLGKSDLEFESVLKSHFELHDLLKELKDNFPENIQQHQSSLIYKVHKINTVTYS